MSAPRTTRRARLVCSPLVFCLCACGAGLDAEDDATPPPFFTALPNSPATPNAPGVQPSPGVTNGNGNGSGTSGSSANEGIPNNPVPVANNGNAPPNYNSPASNGMGGSGAMAENDPNGSGGAPMPSGEMPPPNAPPQQPPPQQPPPQQPPPQQPPPQQPPPQQPEPLPLPTPPGQAFFFDDFEAGAPDTQPAAWARWINYSTNAGNTPDGAQFALLDDDESFRGDQSVHFHAEGQTQPAMLTLRLPANLTRVYIRAFVMSRIAVGNVAPDAVSNHETLIGLRATSNDGNDEIRFGGAKGALGFNMVGPGRNDAVAPLANLWGSGPGMQPNQWHCVEIAFLNDGTPRAIALLDETVVRDVSSPAGWHIPVAQQWLNGLYNEVIIGWQSFSTNPANDVWMDDVVLSTAPIGCD